MAVGETLRRETAPRRSWQLEGCPDAEVINKFANTKYGVSMRPSTGFWFGFVCHCDGEAKCLLGDAGSQSGVDM